jgi:hypothetical protein
MLHPHCNNDTVCVNTHNISLEQYSARIYDKILQYKEGLDKSLDNDDLHHGTELLRLWIQKIIDDCLAIIREESIVKKYQRVPKIVEAIQFNGKNGKDILDWLAPTKVMIYEYGQSAKETIIVETLNGMVLAKPNDYVVRNDGVVFVYPAKIFNEKYVEHIA